MPFCSPSTSLRYFPSFHIPASPTTPTCRRHLFITSSFPPPRHPTRRKNHLRTKLRRQSLIILPSPPPFQEESPRHLQREEDVAEERESERDGYIQEVIEEVLVRNEEQEKDEFVSQIVQQEQIVVKRTGFDVLKMLLLNASMCLAAVFAVQTVWTVGRACLEQKESSFGDGKEKVRFVLEDEAKVEEIRAMAREVRLRKVKEESAEVNDVGENVIMSDVRQEVEMRLDRMKTRMRSELENSGNAAAVVRKKSGNADAVVGKKSGRDSVRRKLALKKMKADITNRNRPKGFNGLVRNKKVSSEDLPKGGIQQIDYDSNELTKSSDMHKRTVESVGDVSDASPSGNSIDLSVFPLEESLDTKYPHLSVQKSTDRLRSNEDVFVTGSGSDTQHHQVKVYSSEKSGTSKQNDTLQKHSRVKSNSQVVEAAISQSLNEKKPEQVLQSRNTISLPELVKDESALNKYHNIQPSNRRELWWLKLPYVLGIFLRRGPGDDNQEDLKGLYSLKVDSHSKGSTSCAIVFQDLGDATNLSYLLESYFEELGDVSADIVPMPIQPLEDAVRKNSLNVTVVRKGQIRLYVGQPLTEVEMALRSIINSEHIMSDEN